MSTDLSDRELRKLLAPKTLHTLRNRHSGRESVFEWDGEAWSTPGTGWSTRPSGMRTLGWRYVRPKE